jgi:demethylmacrocin O-methyltransferase
MESLSELSKKYPLTDKGPIKSDGTPGHNYTEVYEKYLSKYINEEINLFEIGFGGGDSLKLWIDYLKKTTVYCMDNNLSRINEYGYVPDERIKIFYGDQSQKDSILNCYNEMGVEKFDVIIDDGSHYENHIKLTFDTLFDSYLKDGGVYFIEDAPYDMKFDNEKIKKISYFGELIVIEK